MRWIKKILFTFLGLIAFTAISFFAIKQYRASKAAQTKIPENAYAVLRVNLDNILLTIFQNSIANYFEYSKPKESDGSKLWNIGVNVPGLLYFFSLSDTSTCFYSVLEITDKKMFQFFLEKELNLSQESISPDELAGSVHFFNKQLSIFLNDSRAILTFGSKSPLGTIKELLNSDRQNWKYASVLEKDVKALEKGDLIYVDTMKNWCNINFMSGAILFSGRVSSDHFRFPSNALQQEISKDDILNLQLNTNLSTLLANRQTYLKKLNLSVDSLSIHIDDYIGVRWKNDMLLEQDSVVTYDYDENFNPIEVISLQETEVPDLSIYIKASPQLSAYLPEYFFYNFTKSYAQGILSLTTDRDPKPAAHLSPSRHVLSFSYIKTPISTQYLSWIPKIESISQATLKGQALSDKELLFSGELRFVNTKMYALYQIFSD